MTKIPAGVLVLRIGNTQRSRGPTPIVHARAAIVIAPTTPAAMRAARHTRRDAPRSSTSSEPPTMSTRKAGESARDITSALAATVAAQRASDRVRDPDARTNSAASPKAPARRDLEGRSGPPIRREEAPWVSCVRSPTQRPPRCRGFEQRESRHCDQGCATSAAITSRITWSSSRGRRGSASPMTA